MSALQENLPMPTAMLFLAACCGRQFRQRPEGRTVTVHERNCYRLSWFCQCPDCGEGRLAIFPCGLRKEPFYDERFRQWQTEGTPPANFVQVLTEDTGVPHVLTPTTTNEAPSPAPRSVPAPFCSVCKRFETFHDRATAQKCANCADTVCGQCCGAHHYLLHTYHRPCYQGKICYRPVEFYLCAKCDIPWVRGATQQRLETAAKHREKLVSTRAPYVWEFSMERVASHNDNTVAHRQQVLAACMEEARGRVNYHVLQARADRKVEEDAAAVTMVCVLCGNTPLTNDHWTGCEHCDTFWLCNECAHSPQKRRMLATHEQTHTHMPQQEN